MIITGLYLTGQQIVLKKILVQCMQYNSLMVIQMQNFLLLILLVKKQKLQKVSSVSFSLKK